MLERKIIKKNKNIKSTLRRVIKKIINFYNNIIIFKKEISKVRKNNPKNLNLCGLLKYLPIWLIKLNSNPLSDKKPWIPFSGFKYLKRIVKKHMVIFEYGSGGSTLFFSKRVKYVISVEHDKVWYLKVKKIIELSKCNNCEIFLREPRINREGSKYDFSDLGSYTSSDDAYKNMSFESYAKTINLYPDFYFDIIFIDGRSRPSCVKHAVNKLKVNGYLILDNSDIKVYKKIYEYLDNMHWKKLDFLGPGPYVQGFWQLTSWKKID